MLLADERRIEEAADKTLKELGLYDTVAPDMITVTIKMKHLGFIKDYRRVPDTEMPEDEAAYDPFNRILIYRESVFTAANFPHDYGPKMLRARFTIAHEIGHARMEHNGVRHRNISDRKIENIVKRIRNQETEANRFASAFLMPRHQIKRLMNLNAEEISLKHQVNKQAAEIRVNEIERMSRRQSGLRRQPPDLVRQFLQEARSKGHKVSSLDE